MKEYRERNGEGAKWKREKEERNLLKAQKALASTSRSASRCERRGPGAGTEDAGIEAIRFDDGTGSDKLRGREDRLRSRNDVNTWTRILQVNPANLRCGHAV
jgi:hypothetical protein